MIGKKRSGMVLTLAIMASSLIGNTFAKKDKKPKKDQDKVDIATIDDIINDKPLPDVEPIIIEDDEEELEPVEVTEVQAGVVVSITEDFLMRGQSELMREFITRLNRVGDTITHTIDFADYGISLEEAGLSGT